MFFAKKFSKTFDLFWNMNMARCVRKGQLEEEAAQQTQLQV